MAKTSRRALADILQRTGDASRKGIVLSSDISRSDREVLQDRGYLKGIIKGWYYLTKPADETVASTASYGRFWDFLAVYLQKRFGEGYCLSATSSLDVHLGVSTVPGQVIVVAGSSGKTVLELPYKTSLLVYEDAKNIPGIVVKIDDLRVMPLALALCKVPETFFQNRPVDAEIALRAIKTIDELIRTLLAGKCLAAASRLAGAYQHLGDAGSSSQIVEAMDAAGHSCKPENPFIKHKPLWSARPFGISPYAARIESLFSDYRSDVVKIFERVKPTAPLDAKRYLEHVEDVYENDAYHSLSIEGYEVTPALIHRIRSGEWNPDHNPDDERERNALAAKGYLEAFRSVESSLAEVFNGKDAAVVVEGHFQKWYRALFSESVKADILESHHLAGYRHDLVFIRGSRHVPPPYGAVPDAINAFWSCMKQEESAMVRAVLGHFVFGYIHPYMDGNGRIARFLMNVMLASGRYPWTIVRVEKRGLYMKTLEQAVVEGDIKPFARFIRDEMKVDWSKKGRR